MQIFECSEDFELLFLLPMDNISLMPLKTDEWKKFHFKIPQKTPAKSFIHSQFIVLAHFMW